MPPPPVRRHDFICPALLLALTTVVLIAFLGCIVFHLPDSLALKPR